MRTKIIVMLVIVALVLCAVTVMAQRGRQAGKPASAPAMGAPGQGCGMGMGMGMPERIAKELKLTPDQITQMQAIRKDCMDSNQSQRDDIKAKMKQMGDLWMADSIDAAAIKDLAAQTDTVRAQVRDSCIDHAISAFDVLTADQKAKVRAFLAKNPGMCAGLACGDGMGCGMGPGMGAGMGMGPGKGCGMGPGMGAGAGCGMGAGMGQGKGPGAGGAKCPYTK